MWEEKTQVLAEERGKHRAALETELRTLRVVQDELAAKFDDSLSSLQTASCCKPATVGIDGTCYLVLYRKNIDQFCTDCFARHSPVGP